MKLALASVLLLSGCAAPIVPPPSEVAGTKRVPTAGTRTASHHATPKHRSRHRRPAVSRSLRRLPWGHRYDWSRLAVTAYCETGSRNAAGEWPTAGTAAANAYPLGTHLVVQGVGLVVVEDRSAPGATAVDIYMGDRPDCEAAATDFGRRDLLVRVAA